MNPGHLVAGGRSARANLSSAAPRRCPRKSPGGSSIYHLLPHLTSNICLRQRRNIVSLESSGMQDLVMEEISSATSPLGEPMVPMIANCAPTLSVNISRVKRYPRCGNSLHG
ncbi:uncharacterized protein LOC119301922 isoform X4 [Triticum dicoccoides]|uniref:uncharacterized protein LOC119301922 isoform X4 n=1 Tax=Triticum dicoccoides TaxID=85692 RepID=UPI00188E7B97|nr:uncharacterized protein LOC119301922 isoform X4 [Triticum dicoccoides]